MAEKQSDTYSLRVSPVKVEFLKQLAAKYPTKDDFVDDILVKLNCDESAKDTEILQLKQQVEDLQVSLNIANQQDVSDCVIVPVTPFERKCFQYLLERERRYLGVGEELNEGHVIRYILEEFFVKGNKLSLKSIPDSKLEEFKKELECLEN